MTPQAVRAIAQADPVPTLTARWGETVAVARQRVQALTDSLRDLDKLKATLEGHGLTVSTDLGPVGNSAAVTRRDIEAQNDRDFALPKAS